MNAPAVQAALDRLATLHPKLIDLKLHRIDALLQKLGRPELALPPVIHVAGTNGKGSTCAFLRAIGEAAGLRVHVLTSPHLVRFNERVRLAGDLISDAALVDVLKRAEAANEGAEITVFEVTAAASFLAMAEAPADLAVVEVGLGGRFDATNVVRPAVTVVTPVDYDHAEFLGTDLRQIAGEKAGIAKPDAPLVVAHQRPEAFAVIEAEAARVGAPLVAAGRDFDGWREGSGMAVTVGERLFDLPPPALPGAHQIGNAATAVAAALALGDPRIVAAALARGVATATWPARLQRLTAGPYAALAATRGTEVWLDGGHNPHAAGALAGFARDLRARDGRPVALVLGLLARKDADGVLHALVGAVDRLVATGFPGHAVHDAAELAILARAQGFDAANAPNPLAAVGFALEGDGPPPHVIIAGSLYLAGEVLGAARETWPV